MERLSCGCIRSVRSACCNAKGIGKREMYKRGFLYCLAAAAGVAAGLILSAFFTVTTVTGSGMEPAMENGSKVLVNRVAYEGMERAVPRVGSVVAFKSDVYGEEGEGSILVRRVAGSAGDVVEIRDNIFYLNGRPYQEYMAEAVHMEELGPIRLGKGEIFVLSDNRKSSMDSRNEAIGVIDVRQCIGKVCFE